MSTDVQDSGMQVASHFESADQQRFAATLGVWVFLATEVLFFGPLFFGYLYGRTHFPDAFAEASRHTDVVLGSVNTALLLTSSVTMVIAIQARKLDNHQLARTLLWVTALLGLAFLLIKGSEYHSEWQERLFPGEGFAFSDPDLRSGVEYFFVVYFVMTGLHSVHLIIGITMAVMAALTLQQQRWHEVSKERMELLGLYWHFIDVVWIFLYPILYLVGRNGG